MTINEVLSRVNDLVDHVYSERVMTNWLGTVEAMVHTKIYPGDIVNFNKNLDKEEDYKGQGEVKDSFIYPLDKDFPLAAKQPYSKMYEEYIIAQIHWNNKDIQEYNNMITVFNNTFEEYAKHIKRLRQSSKRIVNYW